MTKKETEVDRKIDSTLTGSFYSDSDAAWGDTLVIHFLDGARCTICSLILYESVASLVGELCDRAEFLELVLEVFGHNFALQASDINLSSCSHTNLHL